MKPLNSGYTPILLRTDFSDQAVWEAVRAAVTAVGTGDEEGFSANVDVVDDPDYQNAEPETVLGLIGAMHRSRFIFLVDRVSITAPENPVLVLMISGDERGQTLRATPGAIQSVENNLSMANLDWPDFVRASGHDGIFRGFSSQ